MYLLKYVAYLTLLFALNFLISCQEETAVIQPQNKINSPYYLIEEAGQNMGWNKKVKCFIQLDENGDTLQAKAKFRGGWSSRYAKHSFSVELDKETVLFEGWKKDDDYIFNANYIDKTFVRQRLSYDLFKSFSPNNKAPKVRYKNLYVNNDYQGLYLITEEVDRSFVGIKKRDSSAMLIKDGGMFSDYIVGYPTQEGEDVFQQKYPKKQTKENEVELMALWNLLHKSSDETFSQTILKYFDIKNVIDWHLLLMLTNNGDGVIKNFYWYKKNNSVWRVIPWDYDDSFGRNGDGTLQRAELEDDWRRNVLLKRLFDLNIDNYRSKLHRKWKMIREKGLSLAKIQALIESYHSELDPQDLANNFKKWPIDDPNYADDMNSTEELELMYQFIPKKLEEIDSLTMKWEKEPKSPVILE